LSHRHRRARIVAALALVAWGAGSVLFASASPAQESSGRDTARGVDQARRRGILVVQVEGAIDSPNAELVDDAIERADDERLTAVVLQLDSPGALDTSVPDLVRRIRTSRVPIVVWIGPTGAEGRGGAALLLEAAHVAFAAPDADLGPADPLRLDEPDESSPAEVRTELARLAEANGRDPGGARLLATRTLAAAAAAKAGAIDGVRPTLGETIVTLDGTTVETAAGKIELSTATVIGEGRDRRRQPNQDVVFDSLGLGGQLRHALLGPSTAFFLFVAGLALIVFEFFAASVGFAAVVGGICVICGAYGFAGLPVRWWAIALLLLAAFGFAVEAQAGGLGAWTFIATAALVVGSIFLYRASDLRPAWWLLLLVDAAAAAFYAFAIPPFMRARFSTPTMGREGMIGSMGTALVGVDPDGVVEISGARWQARTNRATPIGAGDPVRVVSVEGVVLEVEPEMGGAKDYRDRARKRRSADE